MPGFEDRNRPLWLEAATPFGRIVRAVLYIIYTIYFDRVSRERYGVATSLDTVNRRVTVRLNPVAIRDGTPDIQTARFAYGRPTWTASQIVGKRVRVWITDHISYSNGEIDIQESVGVIDDVLE